MINVTIAPSNQQTNSILIDPPFQNHQVAHTVTPPNNPIPKRSSFKLFHKKSPAQENEEHPYSVITTVKSAYRLRPSGHCPHFTPPSKIPYPPIKIKRNYTKRKHNNNKQIHKLFYQAQAFLQAQLYNNKHHFYLLHHKPRNQNYLITRTHLNSRHTIHPVFTIEVVPPVLFLTLLLLIHSILSFLHLLSQKLQINLLIRQEDQYLILNVSFHKLNGVTQLI